MTDINDNRGQAPPIEDKAARRLPGKCGCWEGLVYKFVAVSLVGLIIGILPDLLYGQPLVHLRSSVEMTRFVAALLWLGGLGLAVVSGVVSIIHGERWGTAVTTADKPSRSVVEGAVRDREGIHGS